jgi:hypothetical protein
MATMRDRMCDDMAVQFRTLRRLVTAGVRHRHPFWEDSAVERQVMRLMIGDELFRQAYGQEWAAS